MSLIEYQPIATATGFDGRCRSASHADSKDTSYKLETLSLPGQLDAVENAAKYTIPIECTKHNNEMTEDDNNDIASAIMEGSSDQPLGSTEQLQETTSNASINKWLSSNRVQPEQITKSAQRIGESDARSLSQTSLEVQSVLRQASKIAWAEDTAIVNLASPLVEQNIAHDININLGLPPSRGRFLGKCSLKNCTKSFLYIIISLTIYPLLLVLAPIVLVVKLLAVLICCIPCFKHRRGIIPQAPPHFFDLQKQGGFYTAVVVLKERIPSKKFVKYIVSKLQDAYDDGDSENEMFVSQLASQARKMCCVSWHEKLERVELDQHINILEMQISTNNDLAYLLSNILKNDSFSKDWMVYFIEKYKSHSSAIVLKGHHSFVSRTLPKTNLIRNFTTSNTDHNTVKNSNPPQARVSAIVKVLQGPGIILINALKFSYRGILASQRLSGKQCFTVTEPISLTSVKQVMSSDCDISMYSLFLGALTQAFRMLLRSQNKSLHDITIAIPVHANSHVSAFFVVLPVAQRRQCHKSLLRYLEEQLLDNQRDAQVFLSVGKVASYLLFSCIVNHFTSLVVKQASGIFHIVDCSSNSLYFDDNYVISDVAFWPPLFTRFRIGLSVLFYKDTFRVCIVSDQNVTEWPDLFLRYYLNSLCDLCKGIE